MPHRRVHAAFLCAAFCLAGAGIGNAEGVNVEGPSRAWGADEPSPVAAPTPDAPAAGDQPSLQRDALLVELSTAGFYELVARARELALPDSGTADELRARLYEHYGLKAAAAAPKGRTVTIQRAGQASYAKVEDEEGGVIRASGGVILTLVEANGDSHRIQADSIAYDRARSMVTAKGAVGYIRKSGTSTEVFSGETLSANLDDWSGLFLDGTLRRFGNKNPKTIDEIVKYFLSPRTLLPKGDRVLIISADTMLKRSADVMVLKDGVITYCEADDPHFRVKASRMWLLGDKEWAVSDAVFYLGNVPILWLPFFYYPGDELIFHPVLGYRSREGRFLQTTVYLLGSKPPNAKKTQLLAFEEDAGSAKPTKVKGLFLRRVSGPPPKDLGSLKTMADVYSGLGGFAGIQGSFPKLAFLDKTDIFLGLGLSRTVFPPAVTGTSAYSPYVNQGDYASVWNGSDFLGLSLPVRFGLDLSTSLHVGSFAANLALPLYSDTYFDQDFRNRSEDMDWLKILSSTDSDAASSTIAQRTQLVPKLDASFSYKPKALDPWVSSIDISRFSANLTLLSKSATLPEDSTLASYDPARIFFYPSFLRPIDVAGSIRGSLFGVPRQTQPAKPDKAVGDAAPAAPESLRSPWDVVAGTGDEAKTQDPVPPPAAAPIEDFRLPQRAQASSGSKTQAWTGSATWNLSPSMFVEDRYNSDSWVLPSSIDYSSLLYSLLSYRLAAGVDATVAYGDLVSSSLGISYADQAQRRPVLNTDLASTASYALADNLYKSRRVGESAKLTLKPLASSWLWSATQLSWGLDSTIYGLKYDSSSSAFKESWLSWNPESITAHNVSATVSARPSGLAQSVSLTASLPPLLDSYAGNLALNAGPASLALQSRMYRKAAGAAFSYDPITAGLTVGTSPGPTLKDSFVYDATGDTIGSGSSGGPVSNSTSLSWGFLNASFAARRTRSYKPVVGSGWVAFGEEAFAPSDFSLALNPVLKSAADAAAEAPAWSLSSNVQLSQSLVRFSESSLSFGLTASFKVGDQLTLSFASVSQNSSAWRYYAGLFGSQLASGGFSADSFQKSPLTDVWEALQVWDGATLRDSLFKLKSLSVKASRDLHDWTLSAEVATAPLYDSTSKSYSLNTTFTFLLAWKDIQDIKTTVKKDTAGLSY